jgi:hypothetical protein
VSASYRYVQVQVQVQVQVIVDYVFVQCSMFAILTRLINLKEVMYYCITFQLHSDTFELNDINRGAASENRLGGAFKLKFW